jgi:hypothetical protein
MASIPWLSLSNHWVAGLPTQFWVATQKPCFHVALTLFFFQHVVTIFLYLLHTCFSWYFCVDPSVSLLLTPWVFFWCGENLSLTFMVWCGGTAHGGGLWLPPLGLPPFTDIIVLFWVLVQHTLWCRDGCEFSLLVHRRLSCWVYTFSALKFELSSSSGNGSVS